MNSMSCKPRLQIQQIALVSKYWIALTFSGQRWAYRHLCQDLAKEKRDSAYWQPGFFNDGNGAWIIHKFILGTYAERFLNLDAKLYELEQQSNDNLSQQADV